jgi:MSHA biogenesis protein MshJ
VKRRWEEIAEKIDALSLRERGLVFFSISLVVFALLYSALIRPVVEQQRNVSRMISQHESQIRVANQQLSAMVASRREDPSAPNRRRLEDLKRRIADTQSALRQRQSTLIAADRMAGLLEDLVARNRNLELVNLKSLPPTRVGAGQAPAGAAPDRAAAAAGERTIYRHGVELTVQGSYFDLLEYVRQLERLPTQLLWGKVDLSSGDYPKVTMKLTLYTLSLDQAWLVV